MRTTAAAQRYAQKELFIKGDTMKEPLTPEARKNLETFHAPVTAPESAATPATANPIFALVTRASTDPNFDAAKFQVLMAEYREEQRLFAKACYAAALRAAKASLPTIKKNGCIVITDKNDRTVVKQSTPYALYEDIDEAITPILSEHGLVLSFRSGIAADRSLTVTGILTWSDGHLSHSEETTLTLPHDATGSKNPVQAVGSTMSYGKRYTATLLLNIRTEGEDDDGNAGGTKTISEQQVEQLQDMIAAGWPNDPGYTERFCLHMAKLTQMEIRSLKDIPTKAFQDAVITLNTAERRRTEKKAGR